jgi:hypothetical protein
MFPIVQEMQLVLGICQVVKVGRGGGCAVSQEQKENSRRGVALLIAWRADLKMELLHGVYLGMAAFIHRNIRGFVLTLCQSVLQICF